MANEFLKQMQRFQKKLQKKVTDVSKKKDQIRQMYQDSLKQNLGKISNLKRFLEGKMHQQSSIQTQSAVTSQLHMVASQ
jgi:hypothetical protein